jgi:hypothetical protein
MGNIKTNFTRKFRIFWDVAPCSRVEVDRRFRAPLKSRSISTWLYSATSQKTLNFILTAMRTWNLTEILLGSRKRVAGYLSQYSVWLRTGRPGFDPQQEQRIFLLTSVSRPALRPTQPPVQWVQEVLPPGQSAAGAWRWPFTPSSAEVKNE